MEGFVQVIRQHPGVVQVTRAVKVDVPSKHFPSTRHTHLSPFPVALPCVATSLGRTPHTKSL